MNSRARVLTHTICFIVVIVWLVFESSALVRDTRSIVGGVLCDLFRLYEYRFHLDGVNLQAPGGRVLIHRSAGRFEAIDYHNDSTDELIRTMNAPGELFTIVANLKKSRYLLAPVFPSESAELVVAGFPDFSKIELTDEELLEAKRAAVSKLYTHNMIEEIETLNTAPFVHSRFEFVGLVRNLLTVTAIGVVCFQLKRFVAWIFAWRRRRIDALLAKGVCLKCGYEKRKIEICPECGTKSGHEKERP